MTETWEARMSARARERETAQWRRDGIARRRAEQAHLATLDPADVLHLRATCDVCGQQFDHAEPRSWMRDVAIDDDGWHTWLRHCDGPLPDCGRYFSVAREV